MKFSLLLSLYYKETPLALSQCFQSVWNFQSILPDEIILVLDGPIGDNLQSCVMFWQHTIGSKLKVISLKENVGLGKALNLGLKHCKYNWVFRMDTDDICTSDRFEKQIAYIQNHPDVVLLGGQILEFNEDISDAKILKKVPTSLEKIRKYALTRSPFNHMCVAYKKDIVLQVGGYQHHLYMEDYNLWLRIISNGCIVANLSDVILYARTGNGMHSRRRGIDYIKSEYQLLQLKKQLKLQPLVLANASFFLRASARLIPTQLLGLVYNKILRKNNRVC